MYETVNISHHDSPVPFSNFSDAPKSPRYNGTKYRAAKRRHLRGRRGEFCEGLFSLTQSTLPRVNIHGIRERHALPRFADGILSTHRRCPVTTGNLGMASHLFGHWPFVEALSSLEISVMLPRGSTGNNTANLHNST